MTFRPRVLLATGLGLAACDRPAAPSQAAPRATGRLAQHGFVWQRQWTEPVRTAVAGHGAAFESLGIFGGQIDSSGDAVTVIKPSLDWPALATAGRPVAPVFRLDHLGATPAARQATIDQLRGLTNDLVVEATRAGVTVTHLIVDHDCPQKQLGAYGRWLAEARKALSPRALHITALPSWLGEADLPPLLDRCDGWILQVHSVDLTPLDRPPAVCDPGQAAVWVEQAAALGRPFAVALSTYRATAGLDPQGKRVGLALEGPAPAWAPGTRQLELESEPAGLATLVARWKGHRPPELQAIWWYRLPVDTDVRNWRWVTLEAVMAGRVPVARWEVVADGGNPVDLTLCQTGDADGPPPSRITIDWPGHPPSAADALRGWSVEIPGRDGSVAKFTPTPDGLNRTLPPGTRAALGWLRYHDELSSPDVLRINVDR